MTSTGPLAPGSTWTAERVAAALTDPAAAAALDRLGFRPADRDDALPALSGLGADEHAIVAEMADVLVANRGVVPGTERADQAQFPFQPPPHGPQLPDRPSGLLAMAALVVTADDVRRWHGEHGIDVADSDRALTDLGQQVHVHRQTFGEFGLHTQGWLAFAAWTGLLFWLGRLQFNLQREADAWVLSTHIPQSGPLTPAAVDDSFARAATFFTTHFAQTPATAYYCHSWLLDPQLVEALDPQTNIVSFQQRWRHVEGSGNGNADALFFVFRRRFDGDPPSGADHRLDDLPQTTSLERAMLSRIRAGGQWQVCSGTIPFATSGEVAR